MAKRTLKQRCAQLASEQRARQLISDDGKQVKVLFASKLTSMDPQDASQASDHATDAFRILGHDQNALKTNILLKDTHSGLPLMLRISPTSQYKQRKAQESAAEGYRRFQEVLAKVKERETRGCFELGIYHTPGNGYLGFTNTTKGRTNVKAPGLLYWAKRHTKAFLISARSLLPADWQLDMKARAKPNKFLKKYFKRQANLLSPWWTTTTFFNSTTSQGHDDAIDHHPSFLFNFGTPCYLVLHHYGLKIWLDPLDIAIFNTVELWHSTEAAGEGKRWAFSAFYRQGIFDKKGPAHINKDNLDAVLGTA